MKVLSSATCCALTLLGAVTAQESNYTNPVIPGYRPDPSCVSVKDTFYCVSSSFNHFPGLPVYASKDLVNWRHISNAIHDQSQIANYTQLHGQQRGVYAPTIRYHDGKFYIIVTFMSDGPPMFNALFTSDDPFNPQSWGPPLKWSTPELSSFDPDIFWDDDGQAYVTVHVFDIVGVNQYPLNTATGEYGQNYNLWNGTGAVWPEGPHMYKKDGFYYLMLAEGGTGPDHMATIARSKNIKGPYQPYENNPILTNRGTDEYFQAVGHADLFQDSTGNWWGSALSVRTGRVAGATPMGRETVLYPVMWEEGGWPHPRPVRGFMRGPLPPPSKDVPGKGPWVTEDDHYNFSGLSLPLHFVHFRLPPANLYNISDGRLIVHQSPSNLTGPETFDPEKDRIAFIGRRQTHTLFTFSVDLEFTPRTSGEEAGITLFLTQYQHADLGIINLNGTRQARFRTTAVGADSWKNIPRETTKVVPLSRDQPVRLQIQAVSDSEYEFSFRADAEGTERVVVGTVGAGLVAGGMGQFIGALVGVYATGNGAEGVTPASFARWEYEGQGQMVDYDVVVGS
ncbi:glycoside hydrolase family 43 protein [Patellaria atrata CBS 101060]|uniref:Glycoside hydrolase family 43 protein n=1 Tax=Patellaria atrata CBS 101060 TaxID=1346257 RepID=A0A9P4S618_9PEZI|nr:glycoside hydrolase family 43 protein [Patellaria atrata CBS 101060]